MQQVSWPKWRVAVWRGLIPVLLSGCQISLSRVDISSSFWIIYFIKAIMFVGLSHNMFEFFYYFFVFFSWINCGTSVAVSRLWFNASFNKVFHLHLKERNQIKFYFLKLIFCIYPEFARNRLGIDACSFLQNSCPPKLNQSVYLELILHKTSPG